METSLVRWNLYKIKTIRNYHMRQELRILTMTEITTTMFIICSRIDKIVGKAKCREIEEKMVKTKRRRRGKKRECVLSFLRYGCR